jgi:hypothetical protein
MLFCPAGLTGPVGGSGYGRNDTSNYKDKEKTSEDRQLFWSYTEVLVINPG